jgi:hypothetical protein
VIDEMMEQENATEQGALTVELQRKQQKKAADILAQERIAAAQAFLSGGEGWMVDFIAQGGQVSVTV